MFGRKKPPENREREIRIQTARSLARALRAHAKRDLPGIMVTKQAFKLVADTMDEVCAEMERAP